MRTAVASLLFAFAVQAHGETALAEKAHADSLLNRLGLGNARRTKGIESKGMTQFSSKMVSKLTKNLLKKGKAAPVEVLEEGALEQNLEKNLEKKMMATNMQKNLVKERNVMKAKNMKKMSVKDKILMKKAALKEKEEERAFGEKVLEDIAAQEKALEGQVLEHKKKALELATIMEENAAKAKKPLSEVEKKQLREQIEENSRKYALDVQEELMEAKVMEKTALGHTLSVEEKKVMGKLELQVTERIAKASKEIEEQVALHKKRAIELVTIMEENAAKAKRPLSEKEKVQVKEQIEENSIRELKDLREALEEEKAMSKKAFGHPLNAVEEKHVENYMANFQQDIDLSDLMGSMGMGM